MCASELGAFIKTLNLLRLPSTLWALHIDPKQEFVGILHVCMSEGRVSIDKEILLTSENCNLKTQVTLNGEIVHLPSITSNIDTVNDLTNLIYSLHYIKFCLNSNAGGDKCGIYVFGEDSYCVSCTPEIDFEPEPKTDLDVGDSEDNVREEKEIFLCTVCGRTCISASTLELHLATHAPPDDKPFKCRVCNKGFAKKYNLNVHTRVHSGERPYICSQCGKTFATRSNLSTHMNSTHLEEKRHHCDFCEMTFVHPRMLRIHMRKHTGEKPYKCQVCAKLFAKNVHLTIHIRTHTGEKPYVCMLCGKGFTTTGNLKSHTRINHEKKDCTWL